VRKPRVAFCQTQADGTVKYLKTCSECREKLANSTTIRKCPLCKQILNISEFQSLDNPNIFVKTCVSCRIKVRNWKQNNPEAIKAYYNRHAEDIRKKTSDWYYANRECELEKRKISRTEKQAADPEAWRIEQRGYQKKWLSKPENKIKRQTLISAWMRDNRNKMNAAYKRWYVKNQDILRKLSHQRTELYGKSNFSFEKWLEILDRFNHRCAYCSRLDVKLTMDHVIPVSRGGKHEAENVVPACRSCNSRKNNRPVSVMFDRTA